MLTETGADIEKAANWLRVGETVAIPTETVYGLAANALDTEAVLKIYEIKKRPRFNPLILHLPDLESFGTYVQEIPGPCQLLAEAFSPGPITFLLPRSARVPDLVTAGSDHVALRIPSHPMTLELLRQLDFPLAAPSANPSGYLSPVTARHVFDSLQGSIPYILDGGPCSVGLESTIIGFEADGLVLHRPGGISLEKIREVVDMPVRRYEPSDSVHTPGQMKSHYAPRKPLYLGDLELLAERFAEKRILLISFRQAHPQLLPVREFVLSATGDLHEAATRLFSVLHEADQLDADLIIAEKVPDHGLGLAINDRLERAGYEPETKWER